MLFFRESSVQQCGKKYWKAVSYTHLDVYKRQEYKITVEADGYQMNAFKVTYDQILEEGLSLTVQYKDNKTCLLYTSRLIRRCLRDLPEALCPIFFS